MESPFKLLASKFYWGYILLGFPWKFTDKECTRVYFPSCQWFKLLFYLLVLGPAIVILLCKFLIKCKVQVQRELISGSRSFPDPNPDKHRITLSSTDLGAFALIIQATLLSNLSQVVTYFSQQDQMNRSLESFVSLDIPNFSSGKTKKFITTLTKTTCLKNFTMIFIMGFFAYALAASSFPGIQFAYDCHPVWQWLFMAFLWISFLLHFTSPLTFTTVKLMEIMIHAAGAACKQWGLDAGQQLDLDLNRVLDNGLALDKMIKQTNKAIAPFVLTDFVTALVTSVGMLYISTTFIMKSTVLRIGLVVNSLMGLTLAIAFLHNIWSRCDAAQETIDLKNEALDQVKTLAYKNLDRMTKRLKSKLEVLDCRLGRNNLFSPFGAYTLDRTTVVSCYASVITYFIIMIQFRISEISADSTDEPNSILNVTLTNNTTEI